MEFPFLFLCSLNFHCDSFNGVCIQFAFYPNRWEALKSQIWILVRWMCAQQLIHCTTKHLMRPAHRIIFSRVVNIPFIFCFYFVFAPKIPLYFIKKIGQGAITTSSNGLQSSLHFSYLCFYSIHLFHLAAHYHFAVCECVHAYERTSMPLPPPPP